MKASRLMETMGGCMCSILNAAVWRCRAVTHLSLWWHLYSMCSLWPFVWNLRKIFFNEGKVAEPANERTGLKGGAGKRLNWTEREFVVQDFQMLMGAEILTTAENFEWDRPTPHTIRENLGFVFYFSDQHSWSGSACHLWSESKNLSIERILAVKDDFLYRVSR